MGPEDGRPGDLAGLSVINGRLISEAVNGRTDFVLTDRPTVSARVARLSTIDAVASSDGAERELDGLNRVPGLIRSCGGVGGDEPTQNPLHDFTCTDSSEVILCAPDFGTTTPSGDGYEVTLDSSDVVVDAHEGWGTSVPSSRSVLAGTESGTQSGTQWPRDHAQVGDQITVNEQFLSGGQPLCAAGFGCDVFQPTVQMGREWGAASAARRGRGHHGLRRTRWSLRWSHDRWCDRGATSDLALGTAVGILTRVKSLLTSYDEHDHLRAGGGQNAGTVRHVCGRGRLTNCSIGMRHGRPGGRGRLSRVPVVPPGLVARPTEPDRSGGVVVRPVVGRPTPTGTRRLAGGGWSGAASAGTGG